MALIPSLGVKHERLGLKERRERERERERERNLGLNQLVSQLSDMKKLQEY